MNHVGDWRGQSPTSTLKEKQDMEVLFHAFIGAGYVGLALIALQKLFS